MVKDDSGASSSIPSDAIVVTEASYQSDDPYEIVQANIDYLNILFRGLVTMDEVSPDALRSYYVDYYSTLVERERFSEFLYKSRWTERCVRAIREGLVAMGAKRHLRVFDEAAKRIAELKPGRLEAFFNGDDEDDQDQPPLSDRFRDIDKKYNTAYEHEDLLELNAAWLRSRPNLVRVSSAEELKEAARRRDAELPDREQREAKLREAEPQYLKLIRALCEKAGLKFQGLTAGDDRRVHDGQPAFAHHFMTDQGHFHMLESKGRALLFRGSSTTDLVAEIPVAE
jgi:hypothetical protein